MAKGRSKEEKGRSKKTNGKIKEARGRTKEAKWRIFEAKGLRKGRQDVDLGGPGDWSVEVR